MRNVAMFCSGNGVHKDFEKAWPLNSKKESVRFVLDDEMKNTIARIHGIEL